MDMCSSVDDDSTLVAARDVREDVCSGLHFDYAINQYISIDSLGP